MDLIGHLLGDAAETRNVQSVSWNLKLLQTAFRARTLCNGHDAEVASPLRPRTEYLHDGLQVERYFGNQDDVRAAGNAGGQRYPACVASHKFQHHHAVMALGGCVQLVDGFGRRAHGG